MAKLTAWLGHRGLFVCLVVLWLIVYDCSFLPCCGFVHRSGYIYFCVCVCFDVPCNRSGEVAPAEQLAEEVGFHEEEDAEQHVDVSQSFFT